MLPYRNTNSALGEKNLLPSVAIFVYGTHNFLRLKLRIMGIVFDLDDGKIGIKIYVLLYI